MKTKWNGLLAGLLLMMTTIVAQDLAGQTPAPVAVVQAQLDAYNQQQVAAFAATFAPQAQLFQQVGDTVPNTVGRQAIAERYGKLFAKYPQNKSTLLSRMVQGNFVIDHEWITGREQETRIIAIYEVSDGMIQRAWFIR